MALPEEDPDGNDFNTAKWILKSIKNFLTSYFLTVPSRQTNLLYHEKYIV
jgi:hypothetical protein